MLSKLEVLERFGVRVLATLGGRLRRHWLVDDHGKPRVLRRWTASATEAAYELQLLEAVAKLGWPVAPALGEPLEAEGYVWCLFPFLAGAPRGQAESASEQRGRGRLLAEFHQALAGLQGFGQREGWRRGEEILADQTLDDLLSAHEKERPEEIHMLRWHLEQARQRIVPLAPENLAGMIIHGDFTPWNLHFVEDRLTGILDFEMSHWDHRIADFALAWRGQHDEVIYGYHEVAPLSAEEWELLTPLWWAWLLEGIWRDLAQGSWDNDWAMRHLLRRSPLMGSNALPFRPDKISSDC
jgi:Ser/Thr protein kinase RdoA (MazF antagonist)